MMEEAGKDGDLAARLGLRVRQLRASRALTLDVLADRAGVSRSMISQIERGESSPTAAVLDRLAGGLGVTLASLFAEAEHPRASPLSRRSDQIAWHDPETGYVRRNLSPAGFRSPLELVEVDLPPGTRVAYDTGARAVGIGQQVWVISGTVAITIGPDMWELAPGDCLAMRLDRPITFQNRSRTPARYLVALAGDGTPARGLERS